LDAPTDPRLIARRNEDSVNVSVVFFDNVNPLWEC
jgi:hypothetical protein